MKYLRKIVALFLAVVLAAAIAVGLCIIFAVRNVNVTLVSYSFEEDSDKAKEHLSEIKKQISGKVRGTLIGFVKGDEISDAIEDAQFALYSFEKVYPCTLNVTVKERRETFTVQSGDNYNVYDEHGTLVRTSTTLEQSCVQVEGATTAKSIKEVASVSAIFKSYFTSIRTVTEKIVLDKTSSSYKPDTIAFHLRCGIVVEILDYNVLTAEKLAAAYAKFTSLSGEYKLGGTIYGRVSQGTVIADYNPNT